MNQPIDTEGTNLPSDSSSKTRGSRWRPAAIAAIILIAVLASAVSVYSTANPTSNMQNLTGAISQTVGGSVTVSIGSPQSHQTTTQATAPGLRSMSVTTASQAMTSTMHTHTSSSVSITQTTTTSTMQTVTTTSPLPQNCGWYGCYSHPYPPPYSPSYPIYPGYPGYYPGYPAYSNAYASCSYATPYSNTVQCYGYIYQAPTGCVELVVQAISPYYGISALQYYSLHNLSSIPPNGTWVTVTGQMYQGYNTSSTGAGCPGNYINVNSLTTP